MFELRVQGSWGLRERNGETSNFPSLAIDHPPSPDILLVESVAQTATQVMPEPNVNMWRVKCTQIGMDAINADPNYEIIYAEEITDVI